MSTVLKPKPLPDAPSQPAVTVPPASGAGGSGAGGPEHEVTLYDLDTLVVRWEAKRRTLLDHVDFGRIEAVRFGRRWKVRADVVKRIDAVGLPPLPMCRRREEKSKKMT